MSTPLANLYIKNSLYKELTHVMFIKPFGLWKINWSCLIFFEVYMWHANLVVISLVGFFIFDVFFCVLYS